ncbi:MAG: DUF4062 domain-containing protein [Phycisphaerales bacterium]
MTKPVQLKAMISSTVLDLPEHRAAARDACLDEGVFPVDMEHKPARDVTGVTASVEMVDEADIYIGVYAWRYGWVPDFDNPKSISITEMEFDRARDRKSQGKLSDILVFTSHESHPIPNLSAVELSDVAQEKLRKFKERAVTGRVRSEFRSAEELRGLIGKALRAVKERLPPPPHPTPFPTPTPSPPAIPSPPALYARPAYPASRGFIGRDAELNTLNDWAARSDPTNFLLFEAIGGNGKSMLTWEWFTNRAPAARGERDPWAGRFWYSFYERGAVMSDFCRHLMAYLTGGSLEAFRKESTASLREPLIALLRANPYLLVLDGLERVLVAYHRLDASEISEEEAANPTDQIAKRDPCEAIRDEDGELLRALAGVAPSKVLASSRLTPRVLVNSSGQDIPGAMRLPLPGLRPPDAEAMFRDCGIRGDGPAMRAYLNENCANHPLVIGVLAGMVRRYLPAPGDFDTWVKDERGGAGLNLGALDLVNRRNHILRAAMDQLTEPARRLLSTLALCPESVDYAALCAFNAQLIEVPKGQKRDAYAKTREARDQLDRTVEELRGHGLMLIEKDESGAGVFDLHPVVRHVASHWTAEGERQRLGEGVLEHFNSRPHDPYEQARSLEDLRLGLMVVRTNIKMGRFDAAARAYMGDFATALLFNVEAPDEVLALLRPFFPSGWDGSPVGLKNERVERYLANDAAVALADLGEDAEAIRVWGVVLTKQLAASDWNGAAISVSSIGDSHSYMNRLAAADRVLLLHLAFARAIGASQGVFDGLLRSFTLNSTLGRHAEAEALWRELDPMGRAWQRAVYRAGRAEWQYARHQHRLGTLQESHLEAAERLAREGNSRLELRGVHRLRGVWRLEEGDWARAASSLDVARTMAHQRGLADEESDTGLALAKFHLGTLSGPRDEAERLGRLRQPAHRVLAELWLAIGDHAAAKPHALAAYKRAWADGEPYVDRYYLAKAEALLTRLGVPKPNLPSYDPAKHPEFSWEKSVRAAIAKLNKGKKERDKPGGAA